MSEKSSPQEITLERAEEIIKDLEPLIPKENMDCLLSLCRQAIIQKGVARDAVKELNQLRAALEIYEREVGLDGVLFKQNLEICLNQVKMRGV